MCDIQIISLLLLSFDILLYRHFSLKLNNFLQFFFSLRLYSEIILIRDEIHIEKKPSKREKRGMKLNKCILFRKRVTFFSIRKIWERKMERNNKTNRKQRLKKVQVREGKKFPLQRHSRKIVYFWQSFFSSLLSLLHMHG